jgi:hypothetical protein
MAIAAQATADEPLGAEPLPEGAIEPGEARTVRGGFEEGAKRNAHADQVLNLLLAANKPAPAPTSWDDDAETDDAPRKRSEATLVECQYCGRRFAAAHHHRHALLCPDRYQPPSPPSPKQPLHHSSSSPRCTSTATGSASSSGSPQGRSPQRHAFAVGSGACSASPPLRLSASCGGRLPTCHARSPSAAILTLSAGKAGLLVPGAARVGQSPPRRLVPIVARGGDASPPGREAWRFPNVLTADESALGLGSMPPMGRMAVRRHS